MWRNRAEPTPRWAVLALGAACVMATGACGSGAPDAEPDTPGPGAASPTQAVEELVAALQDGDFAAASSLAVPGQAALASLAEGATFGQVADALRSDDAAVAANFWGGFAQGAGAYLTDSIEIEETGTVSSEGLEFHVIKVMPPSEADREMLARDSDGYRIDLFASFAPGLSQRMVGPVERLLAAQTSDSRLILTELKEIVPSLLIAAERPDQPPDVVQSVLRLIELITRVE
jgi:hypothetical protein